MIKASIETDDAAKKVIFDATLWFAQATDGQIVDLAGCGWRGDYSADEVALYFEDRNGEVGQVFTYLSEADTGFECAVNKKDAMVWIKKYRPHLVEAIEAAA